MLTRRDFCFASLLVCLGLPCLASAQCQGQTTQPVPFAEERVVVGSSAVGLTPAQYQQAGNVAALAMIQVQDASIVYRVAGTPASTPTIIGIVAATWSPLSICGIDSIRAFKAIRLSSDAALWVSYYKSKQP